VSASSYRQKITPVRSHDTIYRKFRYLVRRLDIDVSIYRPIPSTDSRVMETTRSTRRYVNWREVCRLHACACRSRVSLRWESDHVRRLQT